MGVGLRGLDSGFRAMRKPCARWVLILLKPRSVVGAAAAGAWAGVDQDGGTDPPRHVVDQCRRNTGEAAMKLGFPRSRPESVKPPVEIRPEAIPLPTPLKVPPPEPGSRGGL